MESLEDAQVEAQRVAEKGAERGLRRGGKVPTHLYEKEASPPDYGGDLCDDGEEFALFEAPHLSGLGTHHGASSGLLLPLLKNLQDGDEYEPALQKAKARVSEALRVANRQKPEKQSPAFFKNLEKEPTVSEVQ